MTKQPNGGIYFFVIFDKTKYNWIKPTAQTQTPALAAHCKNSKTKKNWKKDFDFFVQRSISLPIFQKKKTYAFVPSRPKIPLEPLLLFLVALQEQG